MDFNFIARRLLTEDLGQAAEFYKSLGSDYSFATRQQLYRLLPSGELWGCFNGGRLAAICGFTRVDTAFGLCSCTVKTGLVENSAVVVLPPAAAEGFAGISHFYEWCFARAQGIGVALYALLPVKSARGLLPLMFNMKLCLIGMRPLYDLRPYYIFSQKNMEIKNFNSIIIPISDTFTVSLMLETGYQATDACLGEETAYLKLIK